MGKGAFMTVLNATDEAIGFGVDGSNCMFDGGDQGSDLAAWENQWAQPGGTLPAGGAQYIEAVASGDCAMQGSNFNVTLSTGIGFTINENANHYSAGSQNDGRFYFGVAEPGEQLDFDALSASLEAAAHASEGAGPDQGGGLTAAAQLPSIFAGFEGQYNIVVVVLPYSPS